MKRMIKLKKLLSVLCVSCIITLFMSSFEAYAADNSYDNPYTDISEDKWYYEDVLKAHELGIMEGVPYKLFEPEASMTREMFVTALERMSKVGNPYSANLAFDDVKSGKWYSNAVLWATDMDIVRGVDEHTFGLGQPVTRQQIAAFIYRYLNNRFISISVPQAENPAAAFTDAPSDYARDAVEALRLCGILKGVGDNKFAPKAAVTRAEAAAMLCRLYDAVQNASYKFNLDTDRYTAIEVRKTVAGEDGNIPKTRTVTDKADIVRAIEYINAIEFTSSYDVEPADGWTYDVRFYDNSHKVRIFGVLIKHAGAAVEHNYRVYETDKFKPFMDFIDN